MYLPVTMRNASANANAYRNVGAESAVLGADPHQLIGMVFDAALKSVRDAKAAIVRKDVAARVQAIGRATRLIDEGLRGTLNPVEGGAVAANLQTVYGYAIKKLVEANIHADIASVDEVERLLLPVASAWQEIRPQVIKQ